MFAQNRKLWLIAALAMVAIFALTACQQATAPAVVETVVVEKEVIVEVTPEPPTVVRFVFAPDPLMLYMQDTGIVAKYEGLYNMKLQPISTWDEVAFFAGGHADIASVGDYEVPALMAESDDEYVIFGIYNLGRVPIWVRCADNVQSIHDLKGKKIGVPGPLSSTMIWGVMLAQTEGVDFRVGSDEFDIIVNSHSANGELLREGEIDAGVIIPEAVLPEIVSGEVCLLYGAGGTWEYYRDNFDPEKKHKGVPGNIFLAKKEWFDANPKAVEFFLAVWEEGLQAWKQNRDFIIRSYPEDHGLDPEADDFEERREAITKFLTDHDWFVDTVYLDENWIEIESPLFDYMRETGFMPEDMPNPTFAAVPPPSN